MANSASALKRIRSNDRRGEVNGARRSRIRGFIRTVEEAIVGGDQASAKAAFLVAEPELMRGVTKGVVNKNTASRKVSRLANRVNKMGAA